MWYSRQLIGNKMTGTLDVWYFVLTCVCALLGSACQGPALCLLSVGRDAKQLCREAHGTGPRWAMAIEALNSVPTSHLWGA